MNKILLIIALISTLLLRAQSVQDIMSVPGPLTFNGTEYFLNWSKQNSKILSIQQFLPRDEYLNEFENLLTFNYFNKDIDMEMAVRQKIENVQNLAKDDKFASVNMIESPDGKEFIVEYTLSQSDGSSKPFFEYNIYRFKKIALQEYKTLLILSYTKRYYDDFKNAKKINNKEKGSLLTEMVNFVIPEIKVQN